MEVIDLLHVNFTGNVNIIQEGGRRFGRSRRRSRSPRGRSPRRRRSRSPRDRRSRSSRGRSPRNRRSRSPRDRRSRSPRGRSPRDIPSYDNFDLPQAIEKSDDDLQLRELISKAKVELSDNTQYIKRVKDIINKSLRDINDLIEDINRESRDNKSYVEELEKDLDKTETLLRDVKDSVKSLRK